MSLRGLYNIPSHVDFGTALAQGLLDADIDLADALILLPNRRAGRTGGPGAPSDGPHTSCRSATLPVEPCPASLMAREGRARRH